MEEAQFRSANFAFRAPSTYVESEADRAAKERRRIEEEDRARAFEEESARLKARAEEMERLARDKERLDAPRRYAASLTRCGSAPRYYFDTNGDFQELGKERKRAVGQKEPPKKRVKVTRDEWVYGPNEKLLLEEGECELVCVTRWVLKDEL